MKREKRKEKEEVVGKHPDFSPRPGRGAGRKGKRKGRGAREEGVRGKGDDGRNRVEEEGRDDGGKKGKREGREARKEEVGE